MAGINRREFELALIGSIGAGPLAASAATEQGSSAQEKTGEGCITDVPGVKVGHFTDSRRPTGCTALLFEEGATAGVDYDGSAPGDFQVVLLQPVSSLHTIWAIMLSGGASYGLATSLGAMRYLEERGLGERWVSNQPHLVIPIMVGAILDDLHVGDGRIRPDAESGYKACLAASSGAVSEGCVGAGSGATVGYGSFGNGLGMKSGIGTASLRLGDLVIGALIAVNAAGNIVDWRQGKTIAGARREDGKGFLNLSENLRKKVADELRRGTAADQPAALKHTTIGVVATNATFNKTELTRIAMMANTGAAKVIDPYHTTEDGDQLFVVSTRKAKLDVGLLEVGVLAAEVAATAILRAAKMATSVDGWPAYRDYTLKLA